MLLIDTCRAPVLCVDQLSKGIPLPAPQAVTVLEQLSTFCVLFSIKLFTLHDAEFYRDKDSKCIIWLPRTERLYPKHSSSGMSVSAYIWVGVSVLISFQSLPHMYMYLLCSPSQWPHAFLPPRTACYGDSTERLVPVHTDGQACASGPWQQDQQQTTPTGTIDDGLETEELKA